MLTITHPTLILSEIIEGIATVLPDVNCVFDPTLSYIETVKGLRRIHSSRGIVQEDVYPLLAFNRTVLTPMEGLPRNHKMANARVADKEADTFVWGMIRFEFLFKVIFPDAIQIGTFESLWSLEKSFNQIKQIKYAVPESALGASEDFMYNIQWERNLEQIEFQKEDNFHLSLMGKATVSGTQLIDMEESAKLIEFINTKVRVFKDNYATNEIISEFTVS